jgi:hypothetical protein
VDLAEVAVMYFSTAAEYHEAFDGDPIVVPMERCRCGNPSRPPSRLLGRRRFVT